MRRLLTLKKAARHPGRSRTDILSVMSSGKKRMSDRYLYGKTPAEVEPEDGVNGVLIRTLDGAFMFRVYHDRKRFTDYEIRHDDLNVTIDKDALAAFYEVGEGCILDHSPQVLGLKKIDGIQESMQKLDE